MSPESYSWEVREAAEELYIIEGRTYEQVAEQTGVSLSQLKRWGTESDPSWSDRRREYRQAQTSIRRGVMLAKAKLIASVIDSEDPMKAFAFNSLVKSGQVIEAEARVAATTASVAPATPETAEPPADIKLAMADAVQRKINAMINAPGGITLTTIKELKGAITFLEELQEVEADKGDRQIDSAKMLEYRKQFGL